MLNNVEDSQDRKRRVDAKNNSKSQHFLQRKPDQTKHIYPNQHDPCIRQVTKQCERRAGPQNIPLREI